MCRVELHLAEPRRVHGYVVSKWPVKLEIQPGDVRRWGGWGRVREGGEKCVEWNCTLAEVSGKQRGDERVE